MTEYDSYLDVFSAPDARFLPRPVKALLKERDDAHAKWADAESDFVHLLASDWKDQATAADKAAARQAVASGKNPFDLPSAVEKAERDRPRAIAIVEALAADVRRDDSKLKDAVRREMPAIAKAMGQELAKARDAYLEAQRLADTARQTFGAILADRANAVNWELAVYTDFASVSQATPRTAQGHEPADLYGRPVDRGMPEVRQIESSFAAIGVQDLYGETGAPAVQADPMVRVTALNSGQDMELKASHAAYLERQRKVQILEPERMPAGYNAPDTATDAA
ncbi:hypothetical protein HUT19_15230 [Streptomyces sp. NA02950]|uniref:hypothetical protein n=1 Tax=Streptomyces sp. NA02950 TaxID=2742137 RepID=UPI001592566D|nr:hypothetical protein [Streptomyces sp. NA02950]QKV92942.1 hypothetical protein HUT19_15230 [Streptomyces sp. NA02950]